MFPTDGSQHHGEDDKDGEGKAYQYSLPSSAGSVHISSVHPRRPSPTPLSARCLAEGNTAESGDQSGSFGQRPANAKQLQVFLPRTPTTPASPLSGPWHGRHSDSSSKTSPSNKISPTGSSSRSNSPGSSPTDCKELSPLSLSLAPSRNEVTERLSSSQNYYLKHSSTLEGEQGDGRTPAGTPTSVQEQQPETVAASLEQGSPPDGDMNSEVSPLILAAAAGNEKLVRMLLASGANIDYQDATKGAALHYAAAAGHRGVVKLLLVAGANMYLKTEEGHLPVQLTSDSRIRHLLACRMRSNPDAGVEFGAFPTAADEKGKSLPSSVEKALHPKAPAAPIQLPPLPRNEHFETTSMPKVSPRSESPKNIQQLLQHKKGKSKENVGLEHEPSPSGSARCLERTESGSRTPEAEQKRSRRKSVQFAPHDTVVDAASANTSGATASFSGSSSSSARLACPTCTRESCDGKCQQAVVPDAGVGECSTKGELEQLFVKPEPKATGPFNWTKGQLLGEGAYGKVFSGLNQSTGELMAVKQLKIDPGEGQDKAFYVAAMEREINLYKKLRHKHIVGYINMEQDDENDSLYIFLEYVSGGSIQSMLERFGRFSESLVRVYTRQLLLGLQYLHENKIVHRDIKGGNVLVDGVGVVKLADFGASKAFHDPTVTNECKSIRGSVFWMAPEVIKGDGYGRRADIWSVGCTVIEMLTATHPWPDIDNTWSAIFHIAKASSGPPIPEDASDCVQDFLQQCFQLEPSKRPTATQLLEHPFVARD